MNLHTQSKLIFFKIGDLISNYYWLIKWSKIRYFSWEFLSNDEAVFWVKLDFIFFRSYFLRNDKLIINVVPSKE